MADLTDKHNAYVQQKLEENAEAVLLTREKALQIWDAAIAYYTEIPPFAGGGSKPDFETFYKQLIEGK